MLLQFTILYKLFVIPTCFQVDMPQILKPLEKQNAK